MVTLDAKNLTQRPDGKDNRVRLVGEPIEHQGMRNALRRAFTPAETTTPEDFTILLNKIH